MTPARPRTLYDVLNLSSEAEPVVVEAAYRALSKKYHPDQANDAPVPKDAAAINEAYAVLKDSARRADYDHRLWNKQQAIRLAELRALDGARGSRLSVWGGWLVAGLLACAVGAMALGESLVPPLRTPQGSAASEPDVAEAPARAAAAKAAAAEEAHDRTSFPSGDSVILQVRRQHEPPAVSAPALAELGRATSPPRERRARPAPRARTQPRKEGDFLEREGYIY
jgi:curved DNA-binding protein CbpA